MYLLNESLNSEETEKAEHNNKAVEGRICKMKVNQKQMMILD